LYSRFSPAILRTL